MTAIDLSKTYNRAIIERIAELDALNPVIATEYSREELLERYELADERANLVLALANLNGLKRNHLHLNKHITSAIDAIKRDAEYDAMPSLADVEF